MLKDGQLMNFRWSVYLYVVSYCMMYDVVVFIQLAVAKLIHELTGKSIGYIGIIY